VHYSTPDEGEDCPNHIASLNYSIMQSPYRSTGRYSQHMAKAACGYAAVTMALSYRELHAKAKVTGEGE